MEPVQVYFENIQKEIIDRISNAAISIKVAVAYFTDNELLELLISKASNGISVELIIADQEINFTNNMRLLFDKFVQSNGNLYISIDEANGGTFHNKFCIIDDLCVISGSYNWTKKAQRNLENIDVINNQEIPIRIYIQQFESIKVQSSKRNKNRETYSIQSGISEFDEAFNGFTSGTLTILLSKTQTGKTLFLVSILNNLITASNSSGTYFLPLRDSNEDITMKLFCMKQNVSIKTILKDSFYPNYKEIINISNSKITFSNSSYPTIDEFIEVIQRLKYKTNLRFLIVDDIDKVIGSRSTDEDFNYAVRQLKVLSRELNIPIFCTMSIMDLEYRKNKIDSNKLNSAINFGDSVFILDKKEYYESFDKFDNQSSQNSFVLKAEKHSFDKTRISLLQNKITGAFESQIMKDLHPNWSTSNNLFISQKSSSFNLDFEEDAPF